MIKYEHQTKQFTINQTLILIGKSPVRGRNLMILNLMPWFTIEPTSKLPNKNTTKYENRSRYTTVVENISNTLENHSNGSNQVFS